MFHSLLTLILMLHGLGHALFVAHTWDERRAAGASGRSYSLNVQVGPAVGNLLALLWMGPLAGFVAGAWGLANGAPGWQALLFAAAVASTLLHVAFRRRIDDAHAVFALAVNVLVIALLYWRSQGVTFAA